VVDGHLTASLDRSDTLTWPRSELPFDLDESELSVAELAPESPGSRSLRLFGPCKAALSLSRRPVVRRDRGVEATIAGVGWR
jgi:hypothetical protein